MRGKGKAARQATMLTAVTPDALIPQRHPIRVVSRQSPRGAEPTAGWGRCSLRPFSGAGSAATDLPVQPFLQVLDHSFCQWATGKAVQARTSGAAAASIRHLGKGLLKLFHHPIQLGVDLCGRHLLVDGVDHGGHAGRLFDMLRRARLGTRVSRCHEVDAAALPTSPGEHRGDGVLQPLVSIGGNRPSCLRSRARQRPQIGQPKEAVPENSPPLLPNESVRPALSRESRRCQALNLPWPTFVRGRRGGSAWPGGLRLGRRGYSEHRMPLVAGLSLHCAVPRQLHILPLLMGG